jgi:hypothetical protein
VREDLGEEFVWEGADGGGSLVLSGVEWSGDAHAGFVDLPQKRRVAREKEKCRGRKYFMQDAAMG